MNAIATLLYDPKYLPGALVLGHVLRKMVSPGTKLVVLIDKSAFSPLHLALLSELWDELRDTQVLVSQLHDKLKLDLKRPELAKTFTKIELWNLPFEKVLYLDADTLPLEGANDITNLLRLDFPVGKILAAPDSGFPDIFNSGVFVLHPHSADYAKLWDLVSSNDPSISFDGADQGLLNQYFNSEPDWVSQVLDAGHTYVSHAATDSSSKWVPIPFLYNATPNAQYEYLPASTHFGYPGVEPASESLSFGSAGHSAKDSGDAGERSPYIKTINVSPYDNIALEHFITGKPNSKVKLLHFIGPTKPWSSESTPIFDKWWQVWNEYSKGRKMCDVLGYQRHSITIHKLLAPGEGSEPPGKTGSSVATKQINSPADLCDPSNYQHIKSNVDSSAFSWDATKESPPSSTPSNTEFDTGFKSYSSDWDADNDAEDQPQQSSHAHHHHHEVSGFGVHGDQKPERIFDDRNDYIPQHLLMMMRKDSTPAVVRDHVVNKEEKLEDLLSKTSIDDNKSDTGVRKKPNIPPIFPWESREKRAPERVWE